MFSAGMKHIPIKANRNEQEWKPRVEFNDPNDINYYNFKLNIPDLSTLELGRALTRSRVKEHEKTNILTHITWYHMIKV